MKLEVYKPEETEDKVVRLKLVKEGESIEVIAVDGEGVMLDGGYLIGFSPTGTIFPHGSITKVLGFKLDDDGRIKVRKHG